MLPKNIETIALGEELNIEQKVKMVHQPTVCRRRRPSTGLSKIMGSKWNLWINVIDLKVQCHVCYGLLILSSRSHWIGTAQTYRPYMLRICLLFRKLVMIITGWASLVVVLHVRSRPLFNCQERRITLLWSVSLNGKSAQTLWQRLQKKKMKIHSILWIMSNQW